MGKNNNDEFFDKSDDVEDVEESTPSATAEVKPEPVAKTRATRPTSDKELLELERNQHRVFARKSEQKEKNLKLLITILMVVIVLLLCFVAFIFIKEKNTNAAFFGNGEVVASKNTNYKLVNNLDKISSEYSGDVFKASVEKVEGYEFLCFSSEINGEEVKLFYQNEFKNKASVADANKAFMKKGDKTCKIPSEYDITKPEELVPFVIDLSDGSGTGLLFVKKEADKPVKLVTYSLGNVSAIAGVELESTLQYFFYVTADETENIISVVDNGVAYTYQASEAFYNEVKEGKENASKSLDFMSDCSYEIDGSVMHFSTAVSYCGREYLGQYKCDYEFSSADIKLNKAVFAAYVDYDYEDADNDKIILPRAEKLDNGVIVGSNNNANYCLPAYEGLEVANISQADYSFDENGKLSFGADKPFKLGVDVSKFQGDVDWKKLKAGGIEFAFTRLAYRGYGEAGGIVEDTFALTNLEEASEAGIKIGGYFFTQAINVAEAKEEAAAAIEVMRKADLNSGVIAFDTESYDSVASARGNFVSRKDRTEIAKTFLEEVKAAGYRPVLYFNTRWAYMGLDLEALKDYHFWYACYGDKMALPYKVDAWQYSSKGKLDGVAGDVDLDVMFNDFFE